MALKITDWNGSDTYAKTKQFRCGHCNRDVAALTGYGGKTIAPAESEAEETRRRMLPKHQPDFILEMRVALCPNCAKPTYWDGSKQVLVSGTVMT